jgi:hypothetical protein
MSEFEDEFVTAPPSVPAAPAVNVQAEQARLQERLRHAYAQVFSAGHTDQDSIDIVMNDMARFGRMFDSTVLPGGVTPTWPQEVLEGRRQATLRIMEYAKLPLDALFRRYHQG